MKLYSLIAVLFLFTSCSDIDTSNLDAADNIKAPLLTSITTNLENFTWSIILFQDSTADRTAQFANFNFDFQTIENHPVVARGEKSTSVGYWLIIDRNNSGVLSHNLSDLYFLIKFEESNGLEDINGEWDITGFSLSKIEMQKKNENNTTDYLIFEQNL